MRYIVIWFILTDGSGYIPYHDAKDAICGWEGTVVGVQLDKLVNPTKAFWPDPLIPNRYCIADIYSRIVGLVPGEYHIATTIMGDGSSISYNQIDPHTTEYFKRVNGTGTVPNKPNQIRTIP